jgi:hypothetical protein
LYAENNIDEKVLGVFWSWQFGGVVLDWIERVVVCGK